MEEQEIFRKKIQREQDLLQKVQESQEAKQLVQHDREKQALDEEVEADKKELQKQVCVDVLGETVLSTFPPIVVTC